MGRGGDGERGRWGEGERGRRGRKKNYSPCLLVSPSPSPQSPVPSP